MKKIRLGKTNMMVSQLGFGGIPIQRLTEDEAIAVVRRCLDLGITYIDTANVILPVRSALARRYPGDGRTYFWLPSPLPAHARR